jgi:HAD superfamily hydrolase (TIGR01549 family)
MPADDNGHRGHRQASGGSVLSPNGIRAILFDLDGTLRYNRPRFNDILADFAIEYGAENTRENRCRAERWLHYYWAQSSDELSDMQTYEGLSAKFWENHTRRYLIAFGHPPDRAGTLAPEIYSRMNTEYDPQPWVPPDVFEVLQGLKQARFLLGIVSNRTNPFGEELKALGLNSYLDLMLTAGEANSWKPDTGIFLKAAADLHILPSEAIYVGDNYYADVVGARNAGLRPVLLDPYEVFPEADCDVIRGLADLYKLLAL